MMYSSDDGSTLSDPTESSASSELEQQQQQLSQRNKLKAKRRKMSEPEPTAIDRLQAFAETKRWEYIKKRIDENPIETILETRESQMRLLNEATNIYSLEFNVIFIKNIVTPDQLAVMIEEASPLQLQTIAIIFSEENYQENYDEEMMEKHELVQMALMMRTDDNNSLF